VDGEVCALEIVDTAGQEGYSAMRDSHIESGEGFLLVYAIPDRTSFVEMEKIYKRIQDVKQTDRPAVCMAGNKSDLQEHRKVTTEEAKSLCDHWGIGFIETSAKNRFGVDECFHMVVREIRKAKGLPAIPASPPEGDGGCCVVQ